MNAGGPGTGGPAPLIASLRQFVASAIELAEVRLELLGTELEQQKQRIASGLVWAMLAVVLFALALVMLTACVLLLFWEGYRLQAAGAMLLLFLAGGALAWRHALARLKTPPGAFALSVAELGRDRGAVSGAAGEATRP